jgi:hypothetical protein
MSRRLESLEDVLEEIIVSDLLETEMSDEELSSMKGTSPR